MYRKIIWALVVVLISILVFACPNAGRIKTYEQIYIDTNPPNPAVGSPADTKMELYDGSSGTPFAISIDDGTGNDYIEYTVGLQSGVYYIKVTGGGDLGGDYAIRVLEATKATAPFPSTLAVTGDPGDSDDATLPWKGGDSTYTLLNNPIVRKLDPDGTDIDWFRLILPYLP